MSNPPAKKKREYTKISMVVEKWKKSQFEQFSAVHRISGYPWRLRLYEDYFGNYREIELQCGKSDESELWMCYAIIKSPLSYFSYPTRRSFKSFATKSHSKRVPVKPEANDKLMTTGSLLEVEIAVTINGEKWRRRPILDSVEFRDGILVLGKEKKKINVNKASLASQSSFFDRLFFGDFREKNMDEITIEDVEYEEFCNLFKMIYRLDGISLTDENVQKNLQLADRFGLKIVEDVCVSYLLSSSSSLSIHQRLLIADKNNLIMLKELLILRYTPHRLSVLLNSPELELLSPETTRDLLKKSCKFANSDVNRDYESDFSEPESAESSNNCSSEEN